ncbi:MAG: hypothetical protein ACI3YG_01815 [Prevotella sp.]
MDRATGMQTFTLQIPDSDVRFFSALVKKMGWAKKKMQVKSQRRKTGLDLALEDIAMGNVGHAKDVDDLFKQILG